MKPKKPTIGAVTKKQVMKQTSKVKPPLSAAGDVISLFNNTTGNITITCSITTAYIAGTNTDKL